MEWTSDQVSALADIITGQTLDGVIIKVCEGGCEGSVRCECLSSSPLCLLQQSGLGGHPLVQLTQRGESDDIYSLLVNNGVMDTPISKDSYPSSDRLSAPEEEFKTRPELPLEEAQKSSDMDLAEVQALDLQTLELAEVQTSELD